MCSCVLLSAQLLRQTHKSSKTEHGLEETHNERHSIRPLSSATNAASIHASLISPRGKDLLGRLVSSTSACEAHNNDSDDTAHAPKAGKLVNMREGTNCPDVQHNCLENNCKVDKELVPRVGDVRVVEEGDNVRDEDGTKGGGRCGQSDPATCCGPGDEEGQPVSDTFRRENNFRSAITRDQLTCPVVLATSEGIVLADLGQRDADQHGADRGSEQTPDHGDTATRGKHERQPGCQRRPSPRTYEPDLLRNRVSIWDISPHTTYIADGQHRHDQDSPVQLLRRVKARPRAASLPYRQRDRPYQPTEVALHRNILRHDGHDLRGDDTRLVLSQIGVLCTLMVVIAIVVKGRLLGVHVVHGRE